MSKQNENLGDAGQARADRLRDEIETLRRKPADEKPVEADVAAQSPREFIHERMRELNRGKRP